MLNIPAAIGFLLTVAWMTFYLTLLFSPQYFGRELDFSSFVKQDWNELGDALAGMFAPLAFLWLVVAVFVQSRELNAQHRQLTLQTEEWKQTRKVLEAQKVESEKTAKFIGQQTEFMKFEYTQTKLAVKEELFDALLYKFFRVATSTLAHKTLAIEKDGVPQHISNDVRQGASKILNDPEVVEQTWLILDRLWGRLYSHSLKIKRPIRFTKISFALLHNEVETISKIFEEISPKKQQIHIQYKLLNLVSIIRIILKDHCEIVEISNLLSKEPEYIDKIELGYKTSG